MSEHQIFSKTEISKILSKASEIQTQKDLYGDREGLTELELITLANEVGIDKSSLLEALEKIDDPDLDKPFNWLKGSSKIQKITTVQGEVSEAQWDNIVQEIRKINGGIGKLTHTGSSFEWEQRMQEIGYKHISFTPQNGNTKIQYVSSWGPLKFLTLFMGSFLFGVISLIALKGIGLPKEIAVLFSPFGGLIGYSAGILFLKSRYQKEKGKLNRIIDSISRKIRTTNSSSQSIKIEEKDIYDPEIESSKRSRISH